MYISDEQINQIASTYSTLMGDCYTFESGIPEKHFEDFAREIEQCVISNISQRFEIDID